MWMADLGNGNYKNPILYADYSDPDAIRVGEDFFMIASSFSNAPGLPLLHSKDLVNWKVVNYILPKIPEFRYRNPIHGCGVWAPAIRYHEGTYYVCFPMPDEGIYMTTAKDPFGKWTEPVNIRPGAGWIDPCPFWDEDGKAYLVAGVAKSRIGYKSVLHMVEMAADGLSLIGEEKVVFDGNLNDQVTIEGPKMYKRNGYYYIFAPAGGVKTGWQTVLRSKNIYGPYEYKMVLRQGDTVVNGPHQGAWVDTPTGQDWFIHFQDVYAAGRITHLQPMTWYEDWPIIGEYEKDENGKPLKEYGTPVLEYKKPDMGVSDKDLADSNKFPVCAPDLHDEFDKDSLGMQWQWNANPETDWVEFMPEKSVIKLNAVDSANQRPVCDYRNLLLCKWAEPEFSCVTKISLKNLENGDFAGCVALGQNYIALGIYKDSDGYYIRKVTGNQNFDCDVSYASENVTDTALSKDVKDFHSFKSEEKEVYIKYSVKRIGYQDHIEGGLKVNNAPRELQCLEISFDSKNYSYTLACEAKAGRWVGVKNGVFVSHNSLIKNENRGSILVDYIRYN